ncbi:Chloroperoxidase [Lentinula guzmanii]|uniref:Chloroperoxidase n=1 Tax=Lentinula guzmanii TaxID=2804957 RepID=A0AA38MWZ7_9AGAR|nr:Chloroperoxidase [Lentinula guzmanii]
MLAARNAYNSSLADAYRSAHPPVEERTVGFDAALQRVSTTGQHAFAPPGPGDFRGPCPGLNAMANHGYIPRKGIATIEEFVQGTYKVFGMGEDLAFLLSTYGAVIDGGMLPLSFSIGTGEDSILGPLSGNGLTGSHNNYEGDASPTRGDYFEYDGNNHDVQMSQFLQLYDLQSNVSDPSQVNYDIDVLTAFRLSRFQQSIDNNQYFFNGPITGLLVQPAAYQFIFHFMANKSEEYPEGRLDREVLKSFFSITGPDNNLAYTPGQERIPDNWYKRAIGDEYGIVSFLSETTSIGIAHPEFLSVGGNTGEVDTFTGVDFADLTGGVFDATTLLKGNNLGCFVLQAAMIALPTGVAGSVQGVLDSLYQVVNPLLGEWACPRLEEIDETLLEKFPGYSRSSAQ